MSSMRVGGAVSRRSVLSGGFGMLALSGLPMLDGCASHSTALAQNPRGAAPSLAVAAARQDIPLSGPPDLGEVVNGMRAFGIGLYRDTATAAANWTASPLSIDVAFGMLRAGARGRTARELDRVFGYPGVTAVAGSPHAAFNALTAHLTTDRPVPTKPAKVAPYQIGPAPIVAIANALFVDQSFAARVQQAFLRVLATQYGSSLQTVSFTSGDAVERINTWVATQTRDRIKKLFDRIDPSTVLVLANAVYLKASWGSPFAASETTTAPFTTAAGQRVRAHLMHQTFESVGYTAGDGWQRIALPYANSELSMRVVVPTGVARTPAALLPALSAATAPAAAHQRSAHVELQLPRWNTSESLSLIKPLMQLGLSDAFGPGADLTGIAPGLFVQDAQHRAVITVDEHGTKAAAVTGIAVATSAVTGAPIAMTVDRPFAWAIVHEPTGTPLFTGHVVDPTS